MKSSQRPVRMALSCMRLFRTPWIASVLLLLAGCYFEKEEKVETTLSFDRIADTLMQFDQVFIVLKNAKGEVIDTIYRGKVEKVADVQKLDAPRWDGGTITVSITGIKGGKQVYLVETRMDSESDARVVTVILSPGASLNSHVPSLMLLVGDSLALPPVNVTPENLSDKRLEWSATPDGLLEVGRDSLKALQAGSGELIVRLVANPDIMRKFPVTVSVSGMVPESIKIQPDSLKVAAGGAPASFTAQVSPSEAPSGVTWSSADTAIATVDAEGRVRGKGPGSTRVTATSQVRQSVTASAPVVVTGPIAVESVAFSKDSIEILVGGAPESLLVHVLPEGADPAVTLTLSDSLKASIRDGKLTGKAAGVLSVIAVSATHSAAQDTLKVKVSMPPTNDTEPPLKPTVRVNPAGPTRERRPVWTWVSGGGGAGAYQVSLDKSTFDSGAISLSDTLYKPAQDLGAGSHVLYVRERDAAGNWSLPGTAQVEIDLDGPAAPKIYGTSPTSVLPRWTWTSGGDGGAGIFRSKLGNASFPAGHPESRDTAFTLSSAASGTTYLLFVQERDAAGNWSKPDSHAIKYDLTKPTVAITRPQASGIFITSADTVTVSVTASGPNGIAKIEYTLDGGAAAPATSFANGTWTLAALKFTNAKTTTLKVIATDALGNTGEAELQVLRDSDPPSPPTALVKPSSPTNVAQSAWAWSSGSDGAGGSGLSGKYRWRLNAGDWIETNAASASSVVLAEGTNTFSVQEQDKALNWSDALTGTAVLDTKVPDAVSFVGVDGSYTEDETPTWTWSPSAANGGIGQYVLKLDAGAEFDNGAATTYTPATPLSDNATHTLTVREKDQVSGSLGAAKSFSYKIKVNPPAVPNVKSAVAALPNNGLTNNPGFAWTPGGGGNGKYRVRLNAETAYRINAVAQTQWSLAANDPDGTYTIHVSEQDDLGRWSLEGHFTIQLDRTGPVYTQVRIKGSTFDLRDNFITNLSALTISYLADGAPKEFACPLSNNDTLNLCSARNTDAAGNATTLSRNVWKRSRVVFFRPAGAGTKDGTSWENARSDLAGYLETIPADSLASKHIWLASGDYSQQTLGINFKMGKFYGGFDASAFPTHANNRVKTNTRMGTISMFGADSGLWDGVRFTGNVQVIGNLTFRDCQSSNFVEIANGSSTMFNFHLTGYRGTGNALSIAGGAKLTWNGGIFTDNISSNSQLINIGGPDGSLTLTGNLNMSGNGTTSNPTVISNAGILNISDSVTFDCNLIRDEGGSGNCRGNSL